MGVTYYAVDPPARRLLELGKAYWLDSGEWYAAAEVRQLALAECVDVPTWQAQAELLASWLDEKAEGRRAYIITEHWPGGAVGGDFIPEPDCARSCLCGRVPCPAAEWVLVDYQPPISTPSSSSSS